MKNTTFSIVLCILSLALLPLGLSNLHAAQPEMSEAISQLEAAKGGEPIMHLEKAKKHVEEARHNKGGERTEALHHIDEAINAAKKGEHKRMEEHINQAIDNLRVGKAIGK